jgi:hypothetical protein
VRVEKMRDTLVTILESINVRFSGLEIQLGPARSARLLGFALRGCPIIDTVLRGWVDDVAREHTRDPDTLTAVRILLQLFLAEAARLPNKDLGSLQRFRHEWLRRRTQRLGVRMSVDLVLLRDTAQLPVSPTRRVSLGDGLSLDPVFQPSFALRHRTSRTGLWD